MTLDQLRQEGILVERPCRYGRMAFLRTDHYMAQSLGLYGEFSESEIDVWRTLVRPGDTVVTGGANHGAHVLWFSQAVGPEGRVLTVEPQKVMYDILRHNLAINQVENVEARQAGFGAVGGCAEIHSPDYRWPNNFGSIGIARDGQPIPDLVVVDLISIDQLVGKRDVRLIHLDVEGFEAEALAGAMQTIERCRPYLYVEIDRDEAGRKVISGMQQHGYEVLLHNGPLFNPQNFNGTTTNVFGTTCSINALGIPKRRPA